MTRKSRDESKRRLRPLTQDDLQAVSGGYKHTPKPGEYSSSSGGGGGSSL